MADSRSTGESLSIVVRDNVLRLALENVAIRHGFRPIDNGYAATYRVGDAARGSCDSHDVLVVVALPVPAAFALDAILSTRTRAVIFADDPEALPFALQSLSRGVLAIPATLVQMACRIPQLVWRQHQLLSTLVGDHVKISAIAERLGCSTATIKRDLGVMYNAFGVGSRHELAEMARSLGYLPSYVDRWSALEPSEPVRLGIGQGVRLS